MSFSKKHTTSLISTVVVRVFPITAFEHRSEVGQGRGFDPHIGFTFLYVFLFFFSTPFLLRVIPLKRS